MRLRPSRRLSTRGSARHVASPTGATVIECLPTCQSAERSPKYPPIKFGDYALWFAAQRYEHMAKVQAPAEAEIAPGARATARWDAKTT